MLSFVSEEINQYCEKHSTLPSQTAEGLAAFTEKNVDYSVMLTGALVGSFLGFIISSLRVKRILEIGTYTGYSALAMAERLPADGQLITLDINPETLKVAKQYWEKSPHGKKITAITAPALKTIETLKPGFDLVFIDADKTNYLNYLKAVLPMLSENGIVIADNCLWSGKVLDSSATEPDTIAIREFNKFVSENPELESNLLPLRDGLHLIRKKTNR